MLYLLLSMKMYQDLWKIYILFQIQIWKKFKKWIEEENKGVSHYVKIAQSSYNNVGLFASRNIKMGELVLTIGGEICYRKNCNDNNKNNTYYLKWQE